MAVQSQCPNLFEFVYEDTKITYSTGAFGDAPRLSYAGPMGRHTFSGDEIQSFESARGLEVTVCLDRVSHLRTITLTVFVPEMVLDGTTEQSFRTVGIHATHRRGLTGAPGLTLSSEPLEFDGLARLIEFRAAETAQLL
ncbi:MAG: hypothetical protein QOJ63_1547 [Solirubrobacteraceae bacterium]|jgi:hypothetical protein|nr:hypothetical protein [Solirubrobacteraceae bacterium]